MKTLRIGLTAAAITWLAVSSFAATTAPPPSTSPLDFAKGPAQWLLTREEKAAWRDVKSAEEAQRFIDLFWARRDPTPGTTRNEFHEEFDKRVYASDLSFATKRTRGALSDMGRIYILLGPPKEHNALGDKLADPSGTGKGDSNLFGEVHEHSKRQTFSYDNPTEMGLTGQVVFVEDLRTREYHYDPQQGNVAGALGQAVNRALINPGLKEAPEWATTKAIEESRKVHRIAIQETKAPAAAVAIASQPAGVSPLHLLRDVNALNPRGTKDPLATASSLSSFTTQDDLGYAASLCVASYDPANPPTLKVAMTITGETGGKKVRMTAPEEDYSPDAIQALPGCYLTRGALPLAEFGAGAYKLSLTLTDPTSQQKYNLEQSFKVE